MYNQSMYFFKSVQNSSEHQLEGNQILVKNVSNRLLRASTPPFMIQPNGMAVVSANDPMTQNRLANGLIVKIEASAAVSSEPTSGKASKKSQKKNVEEVVSEEVVTEAVAVNEVGTEAAGSTEEEVTVRKEPKEVQY